MSWVSGLDLKREVAATTRGKNLAERASRSRGVLQIVDWKMRNLQGLQGVTFVVWIWLEKMIGYFLTKPAKRHRGMDVV